MSGNIELLDRAPPFDHEAERAVVASILLDGSLFGGVARLLAADEFHDDICRAIFRAMLILRERELPVDDVTLLVGILRDEDLLDDPAWGDPKRPVTIADLMKLYDLAPVAVHAVYYAERVHEMSRLRRARERGIALIRAAHLAQGRHGR